MLFRSNQFIIVVDANVEVSVGAHDDPVGAPLDEVLHGRVVSRADAPLAIRRAARGETVNDFHDLVRFGARCRVEAQASVVGVGHDGDLIVFGQLSGVGAAEYIRSLSNTPEADQEQITMAFRAATAPLNRERGENPYVLHDELQEIGRAHV